jgi:hypothetical protein
MDVTKPYEFIGLGAMMINLSGPCTFSDSRILVFGRLGNLQNPAPEGRIPALRAKGNLRFFFGGADDFSPGLEGRVGGPVLAPSGCPCESSKFANSHFTPSMDR